MLKLAEARDFTLAKYLFLKASFSIAGISVKSLQLKLWAFSFTENNIISNQKFLILLLARLKLFFLQ